VRIAHPGLSEVPGANAVENDGPTRTVTRAEPVLERREHAPAAQVKAGRRVVCRLGGIIIVCRSVPLYDRSEVADIHEAIANKCGDLVLVGHESEPERCSEVARVRIHSAKVVECPVDSDLQADLVPVPVVVSMDVAAVVLVEAGIDGTPRQRRDVYDHGRVRRPLPGSGLEDGVVVVIPVKTQLAVGDPDGPIIFARGTRAEHRVVAPRVAAEIVVEPDEVLRQQVERTETLSRGEVEVRGIQAGTYGTLRRSGKQARPGGSADTRRTQKLQEIAAALESLEYLLTRYFARSLLHILTLLSRLQLPFN